jgi:hypothetical protein
MDTALDIIKILSTYASLMFVLLAAGLSVIFFGIIVFALWEYKSARSEPSRPTPRLQALQSRFRKTLNPILPR